MPGIVSDIDGVVVRANDVVPGTVETMIKLLTPSKQTQRRVPFVFLSNGGGYYEREKADKMNKQFGLGQESMLGRMFRTPTPKITENEMILCHTILRSEHF